MGIKGVVLLLMMVHVCIAYGADTCGTCVFPCVRATDQVFSVRMAGGRPDPTTGFSHIIRDTIIVGGEAVQAYRLSYNDRGRCRDTVILADHLETLVVGTTLGKTPPLYAPVRPVAEYTVTTEPHRPASWAEAGLALAYGGADESTAPTIGFNNVAYGAEVLVAPFGALLGDNLSVALGGGVMAEGGRVRFPVMGHLRYTFTSSKVVQSVRYVPSACAFSCNGQTDTIAAPANAVRRPGPDSVDRAAILVRERVIETPVHTPYVYVEGGPIFNSGFEGAGPTPSVNPDDYGQYMIGGGVGLPILSWLHAQVAYRYARLNLRTPCPTCPDAYIVNTNSVHALMLRLMVHWGW